VQFESDEKAIDSALVVAMLEAWTDFPSWFFVDTYNSDSDGRFEAEWFERDEVVDSDLNIPYMERGGGVPKPLKDKKWTICRLGWVTVGG
jgi:hypothetical protein